MMTPDEMKQALGENIRRYQKENRMKVPALVRASGLNRESIFCYKTGKHLPNLYAAYLLARAMGMSLDELVGREG